ncbi:hypothetical protein OTK59_13930 [Vibrio natriegens]|uniref:hypothetical protein n=1 Tax=Vibrio natriegens TaxID=691 RepID=UPI00228410B5|nr:hypothetical protein [Vibrio natriegens]MCY9877652.1 hypothetical protein [Vibrio natriegens]
MVDAVALVPNAPIEIEERKQIDIFIDDLIAKHSANAEIMNLMALEATSLATSVSARSKDLEEQGFLTRFKRDFTGENQRVSARNSSDLARSQYLGQKMLNKLAENNLMTYQMTVALGDKVNRVIADVGDTQREIAELHRTLATFFSSIRQTLEAKFTSLERNDDLLFWKETLEFQPVYQGKTYAELTRPEKIVCLANEFFHHSHQQWSPRDLSFFKSVMLQVGHHPTEEKVALKELYQAHQAQPELLNQLFSGVDDEFYLDSSEANTPVLMGFGKLQSLAGDESHVVDTILEYSPTSDKKDVSISLMSKYVQQTAGRDLEREMPFFDVVMNLVEDLVIYKKLQAFQEVLVHQERLQLENQQREIESLALVEASMIQVERNSITTHPKFEDFVNGECGVYKKIKIYEKDFRGANISIESASDVFSMFIILGSKVSGLFGTSKAKIDFVLQHDEGEAHLSANDFLSERIFTTKFNLKGICSRFGKDCYLELFVLDIFNVLPLTDNRSLFRYLEGESIYTVDVFDPESEL